MKFLFDDNEIFVVEVEGVKFEVKPLTARTVDRVRRKHTKVRIERGERIEDVDWIATNVELFEMCVVNWEGVLDTKGNPRECTPQNKRIFAEKNSQFAAKVVEKASNIEELVNQEELKNSGPGQSGSSEAA